MSIREYPLNGVTYKIGYEGLEHSCTGIPGLVADALSLIYRIPIPSILKVCTFGIKTISAAVTGALDQNMNSAIPTYGLWAGPGWSGGHRGGSIAWAEPRFGRVFLTRLFIWRHISSQVKKTWLNREKSAQKC